MATARQHYEPDYAVPPGWLLEERLAEQGMSHAEFARRCGRSAKLISDIIAGKAPLEPETALQFEKVVGLHATVWMGIESDYRLHMARQAEVGKLERAVQWYRRFPIKELVKRGYIEQPVNDADGVAKLLAFFGVASVDAWQRRYQDARVVYRHSRSFGSGNEALMAWLRMGEVEAAQQVCGSYSTARFKQALKHIRQLTRKSPDTAMPEVSRMCNEAGVALVVVKELHGTAVSGATRWLSPRKALIQLSGRHKTDDHFWFSFFHEAAHLLLHSKKSIFVDGEQGDGDELETEADAWASSFLVPQPQWRRFVASWPRSKSAVMRFAQEQGIAPGIVVGMLQYEGVLPWSHLNGLKRRRESGRPTERVNRSKRH